eukprot:jgi/Bigna1/89409/estExt_fgenesh1_pg.C_480141
MRDLDDDDDDGRVRRRRHWVPFGLVLSPTIKIHIVATTAVTPIRLIGSGIVVALLHALMYRPYDYKKRSTKKVLPALCAVVVLLGFLGMQDVHSKTLGWGWSAAKQETTPKPSKKCEILSKMTNAQKIGALSIGALATMKIASSIIKNDNGPSGSLPGQTFVGSGIRAKGPISVYSIQMFVGNRAKSALSAFKGKQLKGNKAFVEEFEKGSFQKTIQLKMLRTVGPQKMITSFNDAGTISSRVPKATFKKISGNLDNLLSKSFTQSTSTKGTEITFSMTGGTSFSISVSGKNQGSIWSPALCKAFADIYVGPNAVSSSARDSIVAGVSEMINA